MYVGVRVVGGIEGRGVVVATPSGLQLCSAVVLTFRQPRRRA